MLKVLIPHNVMLKNELAPKIGNMYRFTMLVIGVSRLEAYWSLHPEAEPILKALHALLSAAQWRDADEMLRAWPGLAHRDKGAIGLTLVDEGCEVVLQINFAREILQIQAVNAITPHGATSDDRQRATDPVPGGLRASPA
jgi:mRNA-degrading endonuclease HigB of HigAB toxin-antitoxin module